MRVCFGRLIPLSILIVCLLPSRHWHPYPFFMASLRSAFAWPGVLFARLFLGCFRCAFCRPGASVGQFVRRFIVHYLLIRLYIHFLSLLIFPPPALFPFPLALFVQILSFLFGVKLRVHSPRGRSAALFILILTIRLTIILIQRYIPTLLDASFWWCLMRPTAYLLDDIFWITFFQFVRIRVVHITTTSSITAVPSCCCRRYSNL